MRDRLFYPLALLAVLATIALALVWPQGLGTTSPEPFGHPMAAAPPPEAARISSAKAAVKALIAPLKPDKPKTEPKLRPPIASDRP